MIYTLLCRVCSSPCTCPSKWHIDPCEAQTMAYACGRGAAYCGTCGDNAGMIYTPLLTHMPLKRHIHPIPLD